MVSSVSVDACSSSSLSSSLLSSSMIGCGFLATGFGCLADFLVLVLAVADLLAFEVSVLAVEFEAKLSSSSLSSSSEPTDGERFDFLPVLDEAVRLLPPRPPRLDEDADGFLRGAGVTKLCSTSAPSSRSSFSALISSKKFVAKCASSNSRKAASSMASSCSAKRFVIEVWKRESAFRATVSFRGRCFRLGKDQPLFFDIDYPNATHKL